MTLKAFGGMYFVDGTWGPRHRSLQQSLPSLIDTLS